MATPNKKAAVKAKSAAQPVEPKNTSAPASPGNPADVSGTGATPVVSAPTTSVQGTGNPQSDDKGNSPNGGATKKEPRVEYQATTSISHDGTDYAAGDDILLDDRHIEQLLAVGAIQAKTGK